MKKFVSVALAVIMLIAVFPLQSFAFTVKLPTVTGVKFIESTPSSMKDFDNCDKLLNEYMDYIDEELDISISDLDSLMKGLLEELYKFYLGDCVVELTLSDGSVVEMNLDDECYEIDEYTEIRVEAYVTYEDYLELKESRADSVEAVVDCEVYSYISGIGKESTFTLETDVVDCYVRSFEPVSDIECELYEDSDIINLEGKKFRVTYADGTSETLTAHFDAEEGEYLLGEEYIYTMFLFDDTVAIAYMDEVCEYKVTFEKEDPYESIEITDYNFSQSEGLTSITYKITDENGYSESFTANTTAALDGELYPWFGTVGVYDSYYICVECDEKNDKSTDETTGVEVYLSMGDIYSEAVELDYYEPEDTRTLLEKIEDVIATILTAFFSLISFFD